MRLLITGATGFVGSAVMERAVRSFPGEVIGTARVPPTSSGGARYLPLDLLQPEAVAHALREAKPTHLLHLAWDVTPGRYWASKTNVEWLEASLRLFRHFAEAGGQRILAVGTCAEYGWSEAVLSEDRTPLQPSTVYGAAKNCLREMLERGSGVLGVSWAWARLFWMYGPGEARGRLLSDIAHALLSGEEAAMSAGLQRRDYLHVDDIARALLLTLVSGHEGAINIGSGEGTEVRQIAETFSQHLGRPDLLRIGARKSDPGEAPVIAADVSRLRALDFRPIWSIDDGLAQTANWWLQTRPLESAVGHG